MEEHERKHYLDLLRKYDDYNCFEFSKDFDRRYRNWVADLDAFQLIFERITGMSFKFTPVQDASYNGRLINRDADSFFFVSLRFSSFGRLVTLSTRYSSKNQRFFADFERLPLTEGEFANLLEKHSFIYVPLDVLYLPYDGVNADLPHIQMLENYYWWDRYFNYT